MTIALPTIDVTFNQLASTAIERSQRGIACIVLHDSVEEITSNVYETINDVLSTGYTADNYQAIADCFLGAPSKVYVVVLPTAGTFASAKSVLDNIKFNYICYVSSDNQASLVSYVKAYNEASNTRKVKGVAYNQVANDDHVINFTNTKVVRKSSTTEVDGYKYVARIAGLLAGLPFTRTSTYYELTDLASVTEPANVNTAIGAGEFVIINDYGNVRVARGVNSLTTLPTGVTSEDFKKITIVEGADTLLEDVATAFKEDYIGKMKNSLDNQMLLISSINTYLDTLKQEEVLDPEYNSYVEINTDAQRSAWVTAGKAEASSWDDETVMKNPYSSNVYLKGYVKFLDGMEDIVIEFNC